MGNLSASTHICISTAPKQRLHSQIYSLSRLNSHRRWPNQWKYPSQCTTVEITRKRTQKHCIYRQRCWANNNAFKCSALKFYLPEHNDGEVYVGFLIVILTRSCSCQVVMMIDDYRWLNAVLPATAIFILKS